MKWPSQFQRAAIQRPWICYLGMERENEPHDGDAIIAFGAAKPPLASRRALARECGRSSARPNHSSSPRLSRRRPSYACSASGTGNSGEHEHVWFDDDVDHPPSISMITSWASCRSSTSSIVQADEIFTQVRCEARRAGQSLQA
jgi:hypothetical protein